ncbi:MAG: pilus assembly protein PilY [Polaromonas sp.]|nr:pilus assembly protein PilY [Polaromonas sp.]
MKNFRLLLLCLLLSLLGLSSLTHAEDIDIYSDNPATSAVPNVLLVLDNAARSSANTPGCTYSGTVEAPTLNNTALGIQQCAIYNVVKGLPEGAVNLGLMVYAGANIRDVNNDKCGKSEGGCLVQPLALMSGDAKSKFLDWVKSWQTAGVNNPGYIKADGLATGAVMQEAWAYYAGKTGLSERTYVQPSPGCQKNFVIYIGNSFDNVGKSGDSGNADPIAALANAPGVTAAQKAIITIPPGPYGPSAFTCGSYSMGNSHNTKTAGLYADEWARYMFQTDIYGGFDGSQSITTYTVGFLGAKCEPDYPALMSSMAKYGGGKYFATSSYDEISTAILKILNEIQAVNSVFSSASLPVSVNAQGTYLNQIFLGMFRPDAGANPRWLGNLRQYQFILTSSGLQLGDSTGAAALSAAGTGFISPNAISFWTSKDTSKAPDSTGGFFKNDPHGAGGAFDSPDGELVEKGGVAQQLRNTLLTVDYSTTPASPRKLYTYCPSGTGCTASLGDTANVFATTNSAITTTLLGVDSTARTSLINWVRGEDNKGDELSPDPAPRTYGYTVRPSIHGDVVHSRPVVINYGDAAGGLVAFYGANDGVFRAVNGNHTAAIGSVPPGGELWGLVLPEHFGKLKRQRDNTPEIHFPADNTTNIKDYFVDGSAGVYQKLKTDGTIDKAYLYLTMRRGGRFIYALDVSDPAAPTVLWRVESPDKSLDSGFTELGQTWSRPRVTVIKGYANPVLVFGAGYDPAEDAEPPTADSMGRGIFVLDALTGTRVWSATYTAAGTTSCSGSSTQAACAVSGMNWAIPADISFVDRDNDGKTDRFYAADLGGNVWRVDLEPTVNGNNPGTPDTWQVSKLAALGCDAGVCPSGTTPRKFFYPPNVVPVGATGVPGSYEAVLLGSGDREHPLKNTTNTGSSYNVVNRFYMLKDTRTGKDASVDMTDYPITENKLFDATSATYPKTLKGFYMTLATGEKVVNASITVTGTTFFGTNRPKPNDNSCIPNLGEAKGYALNPFEATRNFSIYDGGGLPPTPVAGIVSIKTADGKTVQQQFCVGCGGASAIGTGGDTKSSLGATDLTKKVPKKPRRTYWYKQ